MKTFIFEGEQMSTCIVPLADVGQLSCSLNYSTHPSGRLFSKRTSKPLESLITSPTPGFRWPILLASWLRLRLLPIVPVPSFSYTSSSATTSGDFSGFKDVHISLDLVLRRTWLGVLLDICCRKQSFFDMFPISNGCLSSGLSIAFGNWNSSWQSLKNSRAKKQFSCWYVQSVCSDESKHRHRHELSPWA